MASVQLAKSFEEDNYSPSKSRNLVNKSIESGKEISKGRRKKDVDVSVNQDTTLSVSTVESKPKPNKSAKKTRSTRQNNKSNLLDVDSIVSEDDSFIIKNDKSRKRGPQNSDVFSEDEETKGPKSRRTTKTNNQSQSSTKKGLKSPVKTLTTSFINVVTPKHHASPLNISFSPNRSKKTPRKSPSNLGSPKTHVRNSKRVLKVPRKLPVEKSPPSSETSNTSLTQSNSPIAIKKPSEKVTQSSKKSKSKQKLESPKSKSPKIVLKEIKLSKSMKKSPSKKSISNSNKSLVKSPAKTDVSESASPGKLIDSSIKNASRSKSSNRKSANEPPSPSKKSSVITAADLKTPQIFLSHVSEKSPSKSPKVVSLTKSKKSSKASKLTKSVEKSPQKSSGPVTPSKSQKSPSKLAETISVTASSVAVTSFQSGNSPQKSSELILPSKIQESLSKSVSPSKSKKSKSKSKSKSKEVSINLSSSQLSEKSLSKSLDKSSSSKSNKSLSRSFSKSSFSKSKKSPKVITPLSSTKMPKIVLNLKKSPLKSKKSPSKSKKSLSPSKLNKTPVKSPKPTSASKPKKSQTSPSKKEKSPVKSAQSEQDANTSMSPKVVIKKLSSPQLRTSLSKSQVKSSSKKSTSQKNSPSKKTSPSKSQKSPKKQKSPTKTSHEVKLVLENLTPLDIKDKNFFHLKPKNTSTPREKIKRPSPILKSKAVKRLNNKPKLISKLLEDESEPSMNESSLIHLSDVFDSDNSNNDSMNDSKKNRSNNSTKNKSKDSSTLNKSNIKGNTLEIQKDSLKTSVVKNNTYDVESPKTPGFSKNSNKKGQKENAESKSKKNVKVHFTSPDVKDQFRRSSIHRVGTPGHAMQKKETIRLSSSIRTPTNQNLKNKIESKKKTLSEKLILNKTPLKRLSVGLTDSSIKPRRSLHESQLASVNRLSKPKQLVLSEKKSGTM